LTGYPVMEGARLWRWLGAASSPRRWLPRLRFDVGALIEIDLRSLALFRIGVAVTLLIDLASRVRDLDALYGARGVLPPELARVLWDLRVTVSPFTWVAAWPSLLWTGVALLAIAALCLALGVTPRLAAAVAWGLLAAFQDRNMGLVMGGDRFLLLLLMSCILLPTGARLSLRPAPLGATRIRSWAGAGLLLQVMLVYVVTGLKKTGSDWFDGTALWYALSDYEYVTAAGHWLRSQPVLIVPLSFAVKWVEIFGPLLVLSPWRNGTARLTAIGLFWTLHLGLQACQAIGVFQLVGLAAWLAFLPSAIWDRRATREPAGREAPIHAEQGVQPARWSERLAGPHRVSDHSIGLHSHRRPRPWHPLPDACTDRKDRQTPAPATGLGDVFIRPARAGLDSRAGLAGGWLGDRGAAPRPAGLEQTLGSSVGSARVSLDPLSRQCDKEGG